jgi:acetoacetate decarboxylase
VELDPAKVYSMPLIMGPVFDRESRPGRVYGETESLSFTFRTDADAARELVPECFLVPDDPTVTVAFGDYNLVDFMAGDGYRVAYVGVSARYQGEETVDGLHILVMWENRTVPIVTGRELIGIPKLHADITSIRGVEEGTLRAGASVWGHEVMRLDVVGCKEQNLLVRRTAQKRVNSNPWLGYKHIPSLDGPPDASYPMVVWNEVKIDRLELGEAGSVEFGTADESDLGQLAAIGRALRTLPVGEVMFAAHVKGSAVLALNRSRRLN